MHHLLTALALAIAATPLTAQDMTLRLLDHLIITEATHPHLPLREISALAWHAGSGTLLALSDRNDLYHLTMGPDPDRIDLTLTARFRLTGEGGERLRRRYFSTEGVALAEAGSGPVTDAIALLSEMPPRLGLFDHQGRRLQHLPLPPELQDVTRLRSEGNGLESLTLHPVLGYLFAPEAPLAGHPRRTHVIYNRDGPVLAFHTRFAGATSIKGMETMPDGRLLILEPQVRQQIELSSWMRWGWPRHFNGLGFVRR